MRLIINSPEQQLRADEIEKVTLPTQLGEITILPGHQSLISVLKAGTVRLTPTTMPASDAGYVIDQGQVVISVSKGLVAIHADEIVITTSVGTNTTKETAEVLEQMRQDMLAKIEAIKVDGNEEELEEALAHMEKITADLRIAKIGRVHNI